MKQKTVAGAGLFRKTHKSLKTDTVQGSDSGPSSTGLAIVTPSALPPNTILEILGGVGKTGRDAPTDTDLPVERREDQWWYRPHDSKARKIAEKIVVMRAAGHDDTTIAKRLGSTANSIRQYVYIARKNGWLDADDEPVDLEAELALNVDRKIVRNVGAALDGQMTNWQMHEMTIAAAKGRGIFKNHDVVKTDGAVEMPIVAIQVIMPPVGAGDQLPNVSEEQMGGVPAFLEAEVEETV